ncbi:MAG TPA: tetratricopeptide repeat protein, partial [Blastocatellia bacterium]|nr:tetratricopeptide repeat protein [Blastocatellia bacterium]
MADHKKSINRQKGGDEKARARAQKSTRATNAGNFLDAVENLRPSRTIFLICVLSLLAYANSLGGDFVFDDTDQIVENQDIRSWDNLGRAFTTHVWAFREKPQALRVPIPPPYYRPLFTVLFTVEYQLFGLWPQGWHLVSLLLHILCSVGVYYVLLLLAKRNSVAVLGALLFAVYSIHVESVSWISGVTDPLFGVFFLAAFYLYLKYRAEHRPSHLLWSLVMFALSTLSKETALCLVLLIFCTELIEGGEESRSVSRGTSSSGVGPKLTRAALRTSPFLGVAVLYLIPRFLVIGGIAWDNPHTYKGPFINVLLTIPSVVCSYFLHLLWPVNLSITYFTSFETSAASPRVLFPSLALFASLICLCVYRKRIRREVWYGLAFLVIPLLPVLDLRKLSVEYLIFDRYLYLSVVGWVFLIAIGLAKLAESEQRRAKAAAGTVPSKHLGLSSVVAVSMILLLTVATAMENASWANAYSLWSQAARVRPDFWVTHYNSGLALYDVKRYSESRDALMRAAALAPDEPTIFNALGQTYTAIGETSLAIENFKHAVEIDPEMFESINNLGTISFNLGDYKSAERYFKSALALRPQGTDFHYNLGLCYSR